MLHASGFSPLCDDARAACRRLGLTHHVLRDYCHLDHDQHDLGGKSRSFQRCWRIQSASSTKRHSLLDEDPVTHFVVLPNLQGNEGMLRETLDNLCYSLVAEKCTRIVLAMEAREGPNTRDKNECLMAATGHLFEEMMATFHPPGVAGGWQARSSNVQRALRQLGKKNGVEHFQRDLSSVFMAVSQETHTTSQCTCSLPSTA